MSKPEKLKYVPYGTEIERLPAGLAQTQYWLERSGFPRPEINTVSRVVQAFFTTPYEVFGGPITSGDAAFVGAFMSSIKPLRMVEIGVASGLSSALILSLASELKLLTSGPYLTSIDLMSVHAGGQKTGSVMFKDFAPLLPNWTLHLEKTSRDILSGCLALDVTQPVMAFLDGGHNHPWPGVDLVALWKALPRNSWVLCQDYQMMERWIMDVVIHESTCPPPIRGVNIAVSLWPGRKHIGVDVAYNMAALELDVTRQQVLNFIDDLECYQPETPQQGLYAEMRAALSRESATPMHGRPL